MIIETKMELEKIRKIYSDKVIVLSHGVFDIFHYGHLMYLKESKKLGDILMVTVTDDKFVTKGINRPVFNTKQRLEIINELKFVDYCYVSNDYTPIDIIQTLKPNFYTKGVDVKGKEENKNENLFRENEELKLVGGKLVFIHDMPIFHSTNLIKFI